MKLSSYESYMPQTLALGFFHWLEVQTFLLLLGNSHWMKVCPVCNGTWKEVMSVISDENNQPPFTRFNCCVRFSIFLANKVRLQRVLCMLTYCVLTFFSLTWRGFFVPIFGNHNKVNFYVHCISAKHHIWIKQLEELSTCTRILKSN